jgi:hypothetical protein
MLLEVIISLTLFALFGLIIMQRELAKSKDLEEVNTAQGIRTLADAVKTYVEANASTLKGLKEAQIREMNLENFPKLRPNNE